MSRPRRLRLWTETYVKCDCESKPAPWRELLGYCQTHGNNRDQVWFYKSDRSNEAKALLKKVKKRA